MPKVFTDKDTGREYEALNLKGAVIPVKADGEQAGDTYLIRPIQPEPKYTVKLHRAVISELSIEIWPPKDMSADQAQLIKEAVEALMGYISDTPRGQPFYQSGIEEKCFNAWKALEDK